MRIPAVLLFVALVAGCGKGEQQTPDDNQNQANPPEQPQTLMVPAFVHENTVENLQRLIELANETPQKASAAQITALTKLTSSLLPTQATFDTILIPDMDAEGRDEIARAMKEFKKIPEENIPRILLPPDRSMREIRVYGATIPEILQVSFSEPNGLSREARKVFKSHLVHGGLNMRQGQRLYIVVIAGGENKPKIIPGFVWDGKQWRLVGPYYSVSGLKQYFNPSKVIPFLHSK